MTTIIVKKFPERKKVKCQNCGKSFDVPYEENAPYFCDPCMTGLHD